MSIKKHFRKKGETPTKKSSMQDLVSSTDQTESIEYLAEYEKGKGTFLPVVDYNNPDKIARFSSPKKIYELTVTKVYETYPYDGTLAEKLEWLRMSSYLEQHVFENEYPRNNGHIKMSASSQDPNAGPAGWGPRDANAELSTGLYGMPASVECIKIKGGPHSHIAAEKDSQRKSLFSQPRSHNLYTWDEDSSDWLSMRKSNLYSSGTEGNTIEFWFKRDANSYDPENNTKREVIFDMWNQQLMAFENPGSPPTGNYGRVRIEYAEERDLTTDELTVYPVFYFTYLGPEENVDDPVNAVTRGVIDCPLDFVSRRDTAFYNEWHHVAISVQNSGSDLEVKLHVDGAVVETRKAIGQAVAVIPAPHVANIGALQTGHEIEQIVENEWLNVVAEQVQESCIGGWKRGNHTVRLTVTPQVSWPLISGTQRQNSSGLLADDNLTQRSVFDENAVHYTVRVFARNVEDLPWVHTADREAYARLDRLNPGNLNTALSHPSGPYAAGPFPDNIPGPGPWGVGDLDLPDPLADVDPADGQLDHPPEEEWYELISRAHGLMRYNGLLNDFAVDDPRWRDQDRTAVVNGVVEPNPEPAITYQGIQTWGGNGGGDPNNVNGPWFSGPVPTSLSITFDDVNEFGFSDWNSPYRTFPNGEFKFLVEIRNPLGVILGTVESNVLSISCPQ